ncbi:MAG: hypothetical protein CL920_32040 [Deltaproteobacteria bacterium]|nr:hypothetical protein [Deltaproteobacteria bacterium]
MLLMVRDIYFSILFCAFCLAKLLTYFATSNFILGWNIPDEILYVKQKIVKHPDFTLPYHYNNHFHEIRVRESCFFVCIPCEVMESALVHV